MTDFNPSNYRTIGLITGMEAEQHALLPNHERTAVDIGGLSANRIEVGGDSGPGRVIVACTPGIGKVNAATAAAALAATQGLDLLAVIGTAGKMDPQLPAAAFVLPEAVHADYGAHRNGDFVHYRAGTLPLGQPDTTPFESGPARAILKRDPTLAWARITSGDSFVEDAERSRSLHEATGAGLVDMETAAVAQVADLLSLDWLAVKAVSDEADEESATSFTEQLARASRQAAELFERLLALHP